MPSPAIRINGGAAGVKASVSAGSTVTATLDSTDGVRSVTWSVIGTDETRTAASYTLTQSGSVGQTVELTAGAAGTAGILLCEINGGINLQTEQADATTRATAKWYVPTSGGAEVGCVNEQLESDSTFGWTGIVNASARTASNATSIKWPKPSADSAPGDQISLHPFSEVFQAAVTITSVYFISAGALTANDADYARIEIHSIDGSGSGSSVALATTATEVSGGTGDWSAHERISIPISSASVASGRHLTVDISKVGSGVSVPAGVLVVHYRFA